MNLPVRSHSQRVLASEADALGYWTASSHCVEQTPPFHMHCFYDHMHCFYDHMRCCCMSVQ